MYFYVKKYIDQDIKYNSLPLFNSRNMHSKCKRSYLFYRNHEDRVDRVDYNCKDSQDSINTYPFTRIFSFSFFRLICLVLLILSCFLIFFTKALLLPQAQNSAVALDLEISHGRLEAIPIAIDNFECDSESELLAEDMYKLLVKDLEVSGLFEIIKRDLFLEEVNFSATPTFSNWRKIKATFFINAKVILHKASNSVILQLKIWDPYKENVESKSFQVAAEHWRRLSHHIADVVYKKVTGEEGYFDSKIAFVAESYKHKKTGRFYDKMPGVNKNPAKGQNFDQYEIVKRLVMMDFDGEDLEYLTSDKHMALTPRFDRQSKRIIYVTYQNKNPEVFILDLINGVERPVGVFPGMSFAPRFSPEGNHIIMSISNASTTSIYEYDLINRKMHRLIHDLGMINTSPCYSPDGSKIVFNSNRSGVRQIYVADRDGSNVERISFGRGSYATPVWSPRGDFIAFTKILEGNFYIGIMRPDGSEERILSSSWCEEGPTWAPNGRTLMFSRQNLNYQSYLYTVDITGYNLRKIDLGINALDPSWSNLLT